MKARVTKAQMLELRKLGASYRTIALAADVTATTVHNILTKNVYNVTCKFCGYQREASSPTPARCPKCWRWLKRHTADKQFKLKRVAVVCQWCGYRYDARSADPKECPKCRHPKPCKQQEAPQELLVTRLQLEEMNPLRDSTGLCQIWLTRALAEQKARRFRRRKGGYSTLVIEVLGVTKGWALVRKQ